MGVRLGVHMCVLTHVSKGSALACVCVKIRVLGCASPYVWAWVGLAPAGVL